MTLQKTIESLVIEFSKNLLETLRTASLQELTESNRPSTITIKRRDGSVVHVARDVLALTGLLSTRPGLRAEQIRAELRWDKATTSKAIAAALAERRITKKGKARATAYYHVG